MYAPFIFSAAQVLFFRCNCEAQRMGYRRTQLLRLLALGCLSTRLATVHGVPKTVGPEEACVDFAVEGKTAGSGWTLADCTEVWTQFIDTVPSGLRERLKYADAWRETADELRRAGRPCLARSPATGDGVGSTTIRIISSWIVADDMGCDWVTPGWGRRPASGGNGTVLYCHQIVGQGKKDLVNQPISALKNMVHCSVVDWLSFFQFSVPSVNLPEGAKIKNIQARRPCLLYLCFLLLYEQLHATC